MTLSVKVEVFCKEIILNGALDQTKYYAIRIEFQERISTHDIRLYEFSTHQILKIKLQLKTNSQLAEHLSNPKLNESVKT